ncbi:MAG TPA: helix-turn-helix transcriptional regulator [Vicinamibacterales bacterium]|nr:helix-turn-helix transcriptional regulator [Vicinamibacterales bacterium]
MAARGPDPADLLPLKSDVLLILLALADGPQHGYGLIRDVEARSEGQVRLQTGALYRTLRRLLQDGTITECPRPASESSDDERRRYYTVTPFGRAVLEAEIARMSRLVRAAKVNGGRKARAT